MFGCWSICLAVHLNSSRVFVAGSAASKTTSRPSPGYDDSNDAFVVQNSWGKAWGDGGYFHMPYDYITHPALASDFWALSLAADAEFRTNAV